jgi:hypothetical protein
MNEDELNDEYFIPIPVKCLGNPDLLKVPATAAQRLQAIKDFYNPRTGYFDPNGEFYWGKYWQPNPKSVFPNVTMVSPSGNGYYKALQDYTAANPGYRHFIVGYSQGGLVARFLAYIDEYLFDNALIDGIVTIESPNFGSPLGRPANADNVVQSLSLVLAGIGQLDEPSFPGFAALVRSLTGLPHQLNLPLILELIDKALLEFRMQGSTMIDKNPRLFDFLETARKWLSGLDDTDTAVFDHGESAFFDLNIEFLAQTGSVLNVINKNPLQRIQHAAIVGTDNQLDAFVESGVEAFVEKKFILERLLVDKLIFGHMEDTLRQLLAIAGNAYKGAMIEKALPSSPDIAQRVADFTNGVQQSDARYALQGGGLQPLAHDFVIPSAYQLIEKQSPRFLGNWVNPDASHLSGADPRQAGKKSQDDLIQLLKQMQAAVS